jgi:hypothetical protein
MFPISSRIWLINVVLAAMIVFFGILSVDVWTEKSRAVPENSSHPASEVNPPVNRIINRITPAASTYDIVAEKNLFSPDRTAGVSEETDTTLPDISGKKIFLYGVVDLGGQKQALVNHPVTAAGAVPAAGRAEDAWVRVGDSIGNLKVAEIDKEKIVLMDGVDRYEIFLHDDNKPTNRPKAVPQSPSTPTVVVTGSEPKAPAPAANPGGTGSTPAVSTPASKPEPGAAAKKNQAAEDGYEIVETPFGPFKRRIK